MLYIQFTKNNKCVRTQDVKAHTGRWRHCPLLNIICFIIFLYYEVLVIYITPIFFIILYLYDQKEGVKNILIVKYNRSNYRILLKVILDMCVIKYSIFTFCIHLTLRILYRHMSWKFGIIKYLLYSIIILTAT